jgi:isopentenyl phosphate kinase
MKLETSQLECDVTGGILGKINAAINIVLAVPNVQVYFCSSLNPDSKHNLLGN